LLVLLSRLEKQRKPPFGGSKALSLTSERNLSRANELWKNLPKSQRKIIDIRRFAGKMATRLHRPFMENKYLRTDGNTKSAFCQVGTLRFGGLASMSGQSVGR
jgi:hypothetical protein